MTDTPEELLDDAAEKCRIASEAGVLDADPSAKTDLRGIADDLESWSWAIARSREDRDDAGVLD